jgi:hypothetical protein
MTPRASAGKAQPDEPIRTETWPRTFIALIAAAAIALAGCANGTRHGARTLPPQRLAIATSNGVFTWTPATGIRRLESFQSAATNLPAIRLLSWSRDGRYLGWIQQSADTGPVTLHWAQLAGSEQHAWSATVPGTPPSALIVGATGITAYEDGLNGDPSQLRHYTTSGPASSTPTILEGSGALSFDDGFIAITEANGEHANTIYRIGPDGSASSVNTPPGSDTVNEQSLGNWAVSPDGTRLAAERGVEQDGCGFGPASRLVLVPAATGLETVHDLPGNETWRFVSLRISPNGTVDLVAADETRCQSADPRTGHDTLLPTKLFELSTGTLRPVASHVLMAERSSSGLLARISGDWRFSLSRQGSFTEDLPSGPQRVRVGTEPIAVSGTPTGLVWWPAGGE